MAADRQHELVVTEAAAVGESKLAGTAIDLDRGIAEHELTTDVLVEARVPDRQAVGLELAAQELLRERRSLVGQDWLAANHHEPPGEAVAAQAVDDLGRGMTAPGDDDGVRHARTPGRGGKLYWRAALRQGGDHGDSRPHAPGAERRTADRACRA